MSLSDVGYELAVLHYINEHPKRWVKPQFHVPFHGGGSSKPDFVVLDFEKRTLYVVEITVHGDTKGVFSRVHEREQRCYVYLRGYLAELGAEFAGWSLHSTIFTRRDALPRNGSPFVDDADVTIIAIEDVVHAWQWAWSGDNVAENPLGP